MNASAPELWVLRIPDGARELAHAFLRRRLAERLRSPPGALAFVREPCPACGALRGRPALAGPQPPLHFSLAHSGGRALIGIAPVPIGVDLEAFPSEETALTTSALFPSAERAEVVSGGPLARAERFARLWTRKEAYLKGSGAGVAHGLGLAGADGEESTGAREGWTVLDLSAPDGHAAAVALAGR